MKQVKLSVSTATDRGVHRWGGTVRGFLQKKMGGKGYRVNYHPIDDTNLDLIAVLELVTRLGDSTDTKHQTPLFSKLTGSSCRCVL